MSAVLFLDCDGVLNSAEWLRAGHMKGDPTKGSHIDPNAMALINEVVARTGCLVVLSSSWRIGIGLEATQAALDSRGCAFRLIGATPDCAEQIGSIFVGMKRGAEIAKWLGKHPDVKRYAIVDDDDDMGPLRDRLVLTSWATGIQPEHVERLVELLSEGSDETTQAE